MQATDQQDGLAVGGKFSPAPAWCPVLAARLTRMLRRKFSGKYTKKVHRMFKSLVVAILFTVTAPLASAVYKCGSTYSQTPCSPDAKEIEIHSGRASGSSPTPKTSLGQIEQNIKLCERALREIPDWKDRETLKISHIKRRRLTERSRLSGRTTSKGRSVDSARRAS